MADRGLSSLNVWPAVGCVVPGPRASVAGRYARIVGTEDDLQVALESSDAAAELALTYFEAGVSVSRKADGSPVTEADRAVEKALQDQIWAELPDDAFLGEEFGAHGSSQRRWIVDPIDGTSSFTRRDPYWRVHVALEVAGRLEASVVTAPAIGRQWWAGRGCGAFESPWPRSGSGSPLAVSDTARLEEATLDALNRRDRRQLPKGAAMARSTSEGWCAGLVRLLRGEVDCFFAECCQLWDHAPWILLVEEAGGRFTDRTGGNDGGQGGGLYSNSALHQQLLGAIGYPQR